MPPCREDPVLSWRAISGRDTATRAWVPRQQGSRARAATEQRDSNVLLSASVSRRPGWVVELATLNKLKVHNHRAGPYFGIFLLESAS